MAVVRLAQSHPDEALRLALSALEFFERVHFRAAEAACLVTIGRAQRQLGFFDQALASLDRRLQIENEAENQYEIGATQGEIGAVLVELERYPEALAHYDANYEIHRSGGFSRLAGYAQSNRAEILWRLGRYDEAEKALAEANLLADAPGVADETLKGENWRAEAEMELSRSHWPRAVRLVAPILSKYGNQTDTLFVRSQIADGLAKAHSRAADAGSAECRQALNNANANGNAPLQSYAKLALAESLYVGGKMREAADLAQAVGESLAQSKRNESEWRAWALAANANERLGDQALSESQRRRSGAVLTKLAQQWGDAVFAGYRTRPDIQASINSLGGAFPAASTSD